MPPILGSPVPVYTVAPFVLLLLVIAVFPLWLPHWWESNRNKLVVASALGLPVLVLYAFRQPGELLRMGEEYVAFIVLLGGLYVISGGVLLRGDLVATPLTNAGFLAVGSVLASVLGTTGASMLLIRPLLHTNRERTRKKHTVVFFIFLVSNIGGMLTPIGDPPLYLGYLQGVPFTWTFRLWLHWLTLVGSLLVMYVLWDSREYALEPLAAIRRDRAQFEPLRIRGGTNALWLAALVTVATLVREPVREIAIAALAGISLWLTPRDIRRANNFTIYPIVEVAVLFFGIFLTVIPALELLRERGREFGLTEPWQFLWTTGALSSVLDNAPTYLAFLALGQGLGMADEVVGVPHAVLAAISVGAVAMGANTYIGNGPNFMVKLIAEERGVEMPSFFGYLLYSGAVLLPLFVVVTFLFFR